MSLAPPLRALVRCWGENPFDVDEATAALAEEGFAGLQLGRLLSTLVADGDVARAELLVLAAGCRQALGRIDDPRGVLTPPLLPSRHPLPLERMRYVRLALAAARCHDVLAGMLGQSAPMRALRAEVWRACFGKSLRHALHLERVMRDDDVLILGETGAGKEGVALAVHAATPGGRAGGPAPFSKVNAAALPEALIESELFGYVKGAFTGATQARAGRIRAADGGCFFLDEIGDLRRETQVKLLRVIELDEVAPLGADEVQTIDVRFVAATHRDLDAMVKSGGFRRDLYQRLAGNVIRVPPLRARPDDIPEIARAFVHAYLPDGLMQDVARDVEDWLRSDAVKAYAWPGNVRELQNMLRSVMLGIPAPLIVDKQPPHPKAVLPAPLAACSAALRQVEDWYIRRVLSHTGENFAEAARILGVDRSTVRRRARAFQLDADV